MTNKKGQVMGTNRRAYHEWPNGDAGDALDFALDHIADPFERTDFLECWRYAVDDFDGGLGEWPEYYRWLKVQHEGSLAAKARAQQSEDTP